MNFGNCCILNRIASIINEDPSKIKDTKERNKLVNAQYELRKKYCVNQYEPKTEITEKQKESAIDFYESLGYKIDK